MFVEASFDELMNRAEAAASTLGWNVSWLCNGSIIITKPGNDVVSLLSGLHGDERSGPHYLVHMLEAWAADQDEPPARSGGIIIVPVLNDDGWINKTRLWNDVDLNRQFKRGTEITHLNGLMRIYRDINPVLHWDLHEDDERTENYVFVHESDPGKVGHRLSESVGCALQPWTDVDHSSECFAFNELEAIAITTEANPLVDMHERFAWLDKVYSWLTYGL